MYTTGQAARAGAGIATVGHLDDRRRAVSADILATRGVERAATAESHWSHRLTPEPQRSAMMGSTGHTTTGVTRSPRRWRMAGIRLLLAASLSMSVAACGATNEIEPGNAAAVRAAISARLPGVTATDIDPMGDGFTMSYRLSVGLTSTTARTAVDSRAQARMTARIVWDLADTAWTTLTVTAGCAPAPDACTGITLTVHADGAQQLWGPPASVKHRPPIQPPDHPETRMAGRFDLVTERPQPDTARLGAPHRQSVHPRRPGPAHPYQRSGRSTEGSLARHPRPATRPHSQRLLHGTTGA